MRQNQRSNQGHTMTLHIYTTKKMSLLSFNFLLLAFAGRYSPNNVFKVKVTMARSKVNLRSHHDAAHQYTPTNVPNKFNILFLHLWFLRYNPDQLCLIAQQPAHSPIRTLWGENNTHTALKGCGVKK